MKSTEAHLKLDFKKPDISILDQLQSPLREVCLLYVFMKNEVAFSFTEVLLQDMEKFIISYLKEVIMNSKKLDVLVKGRYFVNHWLFFIFLYYLR